MYFMMKREETRRRCSMARVHAREWACWRWELESLVISGEEDRRGRRERGYDESERTSEKWKRVSRSSRLSDERRSERGSVEDGRGLGDVGRGGPGCLVVMVMRRTVLIVDDDEQLARRKCCASLATFE